MPFFLKTFTICFLISICGLSQKPKVWLDADTGNEIDDLYAIVRLVKEPAIDLVGLSSAHFTNVDLQTFEKWNGYNTKGLVSVEESQQLNEEILKVLGRLDIPHPLGTNQQIGRAWGQENPRDSPAVQAIIATAKTMPTGQKLDVLTIGAMTNIASAVILAPEILPKIRCYSLGARYLPKTKAWNKSEFNIRNDLNAFDYLLNNKDFEFIIMPLEGAMPLKFQRDETYEKLNEADAMEKILEDRWRYHATDDKTRIMWDLALVEAYLRPDLCQWVWAKTPPENTQRKIKVYSKINEKAMTDEFWEILKRK